MQKMIVLKNVKTPKTCYECPFGLVEYIKHGERNRFACCITDKDMTSTRRNKYCPIVDDDPWRKSGEETDETN